MELYDRLREEVSGRKIWKVVAEVVLKVLVGSIGILALLKVSTIVEITWFRVFLPFGWLIGICVAIGFLRLIQRLFRWIF